MTTLEPNEVWTFDDPVGGIQKGRVAGRTPLQPAIKKVNPIWWLLNDTSPDPPADYNPTWPWPFRKVAWLIRNPFSNAADFVVGVCDQNYSVEGDYPLWATTWQ